MKSTLVFIFFQVILCNAGPLLRGRIFEWPFQQENNDLVLKLQIGTSPQNITVSLSNFHTDHELQVVESDYVGGQYNHRHSVSNQYGEYVYDSDTKNAIGQRCWDTLIINGQNYTNAPFVCQDQAPLDYGAQLGFGYNKKAEKVTVPPRYTPGIHEESFWNHFFARLPSWNVTVAFDKYPESGAIVLGALDKTRCAKDWLLFNETVWKNDKKETHFGAVVDSLQIGRYAFKNPGKVYFKLNNETTHWPQRVYKSVLKGLGSVDSKTIPCNTQQTINFELGKVILVIAPEDYIDKNEQGECVLNGISVDSDEFSLSKQMVFKKNCLVINHKKQFLGFAQRLNKN